MPRRSPPTEDPHAIGVATRGGPFAGADPRVVRRRAGKMLRHLALDPVELSIALVDDRTIRALNRRYRGIDRPTDVLAFAVRESGPPAGGGAGCELLGDVVISVPTAERQARRRRRVLLDELTTLLAHGLLHLLGHDHGTRVQQREMKRLTGELEQAAARSLRRDR